MLEHLKEQVLLSNRSLVNQGLIKFDWETISGIDRESDLVVVKPGHIHVNDLKLKDMLVLNLYGQVVEGNQEPSDDAATHLVLYRQFKEVGGIVHAHFEWAASWAQAGRSIPVLGTTHARFFDGEIPCTRKMIMKEIPGNYERETGRIIVECFEGIDPLRVPAVLVQHHGAFSWGTDVSSAVENAVALEEVAKMAFRTLILNPDPIMEQDTARTRFPGI